MGVNDYGTGTDLLNSPDLGDWAASVATALNNSDTTVDARIAAAVPFWLVAGVLRNSSGFYLLDDADHTPMGLTSTVTTTSTYIRITFASTVTQVGSLVVTGDDVWAGTYLVGASVALTHADLYVFSRATGAAVDPTGIESGGSGNFWVYGVMR